MRISDWSSDVCSSDLIAPRPSPLLFENGRPDLEVHSTHSAHSTHAARHARRRGLVFGHFRDSRFGGDEQARDGSRVLQRSTDDLGRIDDAGLHQVFIDFKSEEHTSELQSLMRISYAVFCLNNTQKTN